MKGGVIRWHQGLVGKGDVATSPFLLRVIRKEIGE